MKLNWSRFFTLFLLFNAVLLISGCSASWISSANMLWPAIEAAISAIFAFIGSVKSIPASVLSTVQKIEEDVTTSLANAKTILAGLAQNATATAMQEFQAVLQLVVQNLQSILSGFSVTNPDTVSTVTRLVNLGIAALEAILAIIPLALKATASPMGDHELAAADRVISTNLKAEHKALQEAYHEIVSTPTDDAEVDEALAALPQTLP